MKLVTRRILFCICFIIFLISSPLIILYAFGFRYDFAQKKVMQTGIIYLTPNIQDNIKILVNDKEELNKTSIKGIFNKEFVLYNLIPKTYNIKIKKENFHTWEKNLVVLPGLITYAQPLLLPSDPKINLIFSDTNIPLWSISDAYKKIFYVKNENEKITINTYDFSKKIFNSAQINLTRDKSKVSNITPNNSSILYAPDEKKFSIVITEEFTRIILANSTGKNISIIADFISNDKIIDEHWDESSNFFLYLSEKGEIYSFDVSTKKINKIINNAYGFIPKNNDIYFLNQENLFIYQTSINNSLEKKQLSYVPLDIIQNNNQTEKEKDKKIEKKATLIISPKNSIALITQENELYVVHQDGVPIRLGNNIESAVFSKNGENLIFNSPYEIFINSLNSDQENLVTRLSQKVSNVNWYNDYKHIWFLTNQTLKNIELDSRPSPNIIDFINAPQKISKIIYTDSNTIYYDQTNDQTISFYQALIQN